MSNRIKRNVLVAVCQIAVTSVVFILLYRVLLDKIGVEAMGVWSVVAAVSSTAGIAQLGLGGGVVKYVAKYLARTDVESTNRVIDTAAISTMVLYTVGAILLYFPLSWVLDGVIDEPFIGMAQNILPLSMAVIALNATALVFQSALDGAQRIDMRGYIVMAGSVVYLGGAYYQVESNGLFGLLVAQLIQAVFLLIASMFFVGRVIHGRRIVPRYWGWKECRELLAYGVPFQIISLAQIYTDPVTKVLLGHFGGLAVVGYYEMANRMVMQLRSIFVAANQVLIPLVSTIRETRSRGLDALYINSFRMTFFIAVPFFSVLISMSPFISVMWIGFYQDVFVLSVCLLAFSRCINALASSAYFSFLGEGNLRPLVKGHLYISLLNLVVGALLGNLVPETGVIVGWAVALSLGSMYMVWKYHSVYGHSLRVIVSWSGSLLFIVSIALSVFGFFVYQYTGGSLSGLGVVIMMYCFVVLPVMFNSPVFSVITGAIRGK